MSWTTTIEQDGDEAILTFPPEMMEQLGWKEGDELHLTVNEDKSLTIVNVSRLTADSEKWEDGTYGCSEEHARRASPESEARLKAALSGITLDSE